MQEGVSLNCIETETVQLDRYDSLCVNPCKINRECTSYINNSSHRHIHVFKVDGLQIIVVAKKYIYVS